MGDWLAQGQGKRIMSNANMLWLVHVQYLKIWRVKCPCLAEGECSCECSRLERHTAVGKAEHSVPMQETNLEFFGFFGCGFSGQKSWVELGTGEHREPSNQSNPCQDPISAPGQELVAGFLMMRNEVNTIPVYVWHEMVVPQLLHYPPQIHSIVFASKWTCMPIVLKRSSLSFSFMLGKLCFPLISPEMKRRRMSRCWCEQRCLWNPQLSIFRRSHRKALQTVVRQSSLHWQPWSCGDDHNGFGFLWDYWVQVLGGSFGSTMGTVSIST